MSGLTGEFSEASWQKNEKLEGAQLRRLIHQGIGHLDDDAEIFRHHPEPLHLKARLHLTGCPILGSWTRHLSDVPALHLSLACDVHLCSQVGVSLVGGLQSASEHLPYFVLGVTLSQVGRGVTRHCVEDPFFQFCYVGFDLRGAAETDLYPRRGRIVVCFRVEQDLRGSWVPF